jgi:hypothetical protein
LPGSARWRFWASIFEFGTWMKVNNPALSRTFFS